MIISELTLSYPCVKYNIEVSHFTARKSTVIEWVILESVNKCMNLSQYAEISIGAFFEQIFTISAADLLIRPCLIELQDMGAITLSGIDDETELNNVPMSRIKLTSVGQEMQKQGLLPGATAEDTFQIYYEVIPRCLIEGTSVYKEKPTGLEVLNIKDEDEIEFPMAAVRNWLGERQREKKQGKMSWLTPTTRIEDISPKKAILLWQNVTRKIDLGEGLVWKIVGNDEVSIDEASMMKSTLSCPDEYAELGYSNIHNPDSDIEEIVSIDEISGLIKSRLMEDNLFCVDEKYYVKIDASRFSKKKKVRIGVVYGSESFAVENAIKEIVIRIPENDLQEYGVYFNANKSIQIGKFDVRAGLKHKDIVLAYVPKKKTVKFSDILVSIVDKHAQEDYSLLFVLSELGLNKLFLEYVGRILSNFKTVQDKADTIKDINLRSKKYYNQKMISVTDSEKLLIDESYVVENSQNIEEAMEILREYSTVNVFRQNEVFFQRILKLVLENIENQDNPENIWRLWKEIKGLKKSYIDWIVKNALYKNIYSKKCVQEIIDRFVNDNLFEIEEYTPVEQIILNMRRISIRLQEMLPEIDIFEKYSEEKFAEIILNHRDILDELYDEVRKWRDEEERFALKIYNIDEIRLAESAVFKASDNIMKILGALSIFYDNSFMKYSKVYIVDTCTLMNEPSLISWFDDNKSMLIIPMMVLDELDGLKSDENEKTAYSAREVIRAINNYKFYDWVNTGEVSHPELLPRDMDSERNDSKILSIAIRYIVKKPILLTDDINLSNIADANHIQSINLNAFQSMKKHEKVSESGKKAKRKIKRRNEVI